ncbi:hypothetical protein QVD17_10059 [Tagetes erecta]|uniref:VQ domain-containing protein n=1 Tax=Tagetes erecta TaxID=13708 RepID=A0AAD8L251_TARER|nr:hypothetical protein QVD17_10059 [Tagetes erecta]
MNQFSSSITSSSYEQQQQTSLKSTKSSYHNSLHSVRRPTTKHFIAPLPPTPLKIYNVEASKFKDVVRVLTSTPEFQYPSATRRLKDKAPPPLTLSSIPKPSLPPPVDDDGGELLSPLSSFIMSTDFCNILNETMQTNSNNRFTTGGIMECFHQDLSTDEAVGHDTVIGLSPTSLSWCSSLLFSPGMNQSQVN